MDDLDLFLSGINFMCNGIIIPMLLIMDFSKSHLPKGTSFSSQSTNIRALAKVKILMTGSFAA